MKGFKFLVLILIFKLISVVCLSEYHLLDLTYVCLHNSECHLTLKLDYKPEIVYIARYGQCYEPEISGRINLDLIELQDVPSGTSQPPSKYFRSIFKVDTPESERSICLFKSTDKLHPIDVRIIQFYDIFPFYSIDDNNHLRIILTKCRQENIELQVSNKYEYENPMKASNFISCDDKIVSYFHLNNVIEQSKPFSDVFVFLFFKSKTTHPTFLYRKTVFNHNNISSFDHKIVDKQIIAEIKFQNPEPFKQNENSLFADNKFFLSAQSTEDINGLESKCGDENLQWSVQNLAFKISDNGIIFLLPLDLYGKTVRICASFTVDKPEDYKIPLYSFEVNDKTSGYFKNVFYSNPLGITEIKLNSDFHPLSEIMLVHACDLASVPVYPSSIFDTSKCYTITGHKMADNKLTKYNSNFSYNSEELYRSLYYKDVLFDDFIPHKPVYLPDKSVVSEYGTKWIKNSMFLPRLYLDNIHPYLLVACDRWKHPFCFTQDEFDSIVGIVLPSKRSFLEFTAEWENEDMIVEIKTNSLEQFLVKLIMSRNMQYTDYQSICNGRKGVYPDSYNKRSEDPWNYYKNTFKGLKLGKIYYVCLINLKVHNKLTKKFDEMYSTQGNSDYSGIDCNPKFEITWDFIGVINTQTPLSGTHFIINRHDDAAKIIFPTTGFLDESNFVSFFLSNDLSANCKILKQTELTPITTTKNEYSSFITIVKEHYSYKDITEESRKPEGLWLPDDAGHWISFGNYISYFGEFKPKENFYKVCACVEGACYFAGNAIESKMESFELNQIVKSNDFYDRFIYGTNICFYNRRKLSCFSQSGDLETSLKYDVKFDVQQVQINHLSFDEENEVLCLLSPNSVYVFEDEPEPKIIIEGINNMEMMFSFSDVTFFVCSEHVHISVGESSIGHLISTKRAGPKLKAKETIVFNKDIKKLDSIKIPVTDDINNVHIYRKHDNIYSCFLINEHLFLEYYEIDVDFKNKSHFAQKIDVIDIIEFFPGVKHGVRLIVSTRLLANQEKFIIFLSHQEFDEIRVFFLDDKQIKYYSSVRSIPGTIDFVTTETHIMSLNAILFEDQFSEYVIQIEYDYLLEVTIKYPKLTELQFNNEYSFLPEVTNGVPLKFYIFEYISDENVLEEEIQETGLKLNRKTGEIFGTSRFNGEVEVLLHVDFLLGNRTLLLKLLSRCPLGHQYSTPFRECVECELGYYRHKLSLDSCLRCDDYMANTTTKNYGSTSPLDCVCKPGFYTSTKACLMCPEGTYNDQLDAISCDKTCLPNQISSVVGASSLEELKCTCIEGYFNKNGWCEECHQGTYCPGNNVVYTCPENTSTIGLGSKSLNDCLCNAGYEFLEEGCKPCNIHSYKSTISNDKCTLCSADTPDDVYSYSKNPGSTSKDQCIYCMPGYYHNGKSCSHCPDKSFCKGGNFAPISCGANSIVKKESPSSQDDCMCPEGYGFTTMSLVGSTSRKCIKCPLNTFQPIDGTQGACIKCPENTYTLKEGSTSLLDCIPLSGYFNLVDNYKVMVENIESSHQTYNEIILQSLKVNCYRSVELISPSNMILREDIESCVELCKLNPYCKYAHYYRFTQFAVTSETPKENFCSLYTTFGNKIPIIKYEPVSIRDDNHGPVVCEIVRDYVYPKFLLCPRNYYCPGGLNSLLIKCPLNSVTLIEGSSNPDQCLCLPGYYPYNNFCTPCKKGSYKPTISNELCTKCPQNTTTPMEGSFFINQCTCTKNKYAAPLIRPKITTTNRIIYTNTVIDAHQHGTKDINEESFDIDWLLSENIKDLVNRKLDFYCSTCLYGYFCKGMRLFSKFHMPPVPCYAGSSVPISSTKQSTTSCMCNPGYGTRPLLSHLDTGFGMECEKCLPGTFKSVYENEPCHELCPVYSTSLPGSKSEKECFCIPGFYNNFENGKFQCKKCPFGSICYGGIQNGIHTKPTPKSGFAIVDINNISSEYTNSFLQTFPQDTNSVVKNDHIRLTYPCVTPARCIGGGTCFEGSSGLLCTECDPGYDLHHFNSKCKKCLSNIGELIKIILPRIILYCLIILLSLYNKRANSTSELSLVTIFKILYSYTLSLVPLGIIPSNSPSSIRKFYNFYEKFFYHPLNFYAYVDRVNCFRNLAVYVDFILSHLGFVKSAPELTEHNYIEIWYLQRYFGIFKLIFDIIFIFIIDFILYIVNKTLSICQRSLKRRLKFLRIKIGPSNVSLSTSYDETEIKFENHPKLIIQHIIVLICLHLPSISLNSLSMIWCTKFPLREGYVLLHMPNQVCTFKNRYFLFGSIVSGSSMGFIFMFLLFLFFKFRNCEYTSGWGNIFITGYRKKYRNWDVIQLIRQMLIIFLIVCRNSIDSNKSEINRILFYLIIHIMYLVIMLSIKPYDSRSGFVFLNLEKYLIASNIFSSMFMYGSYFHNFSVISGLPFIVSAISYVFIFSTLLREFITICCIISRPREYFWRNFTSSFISFFKHNHSLLYFNQDDDTVVFEAYNISKKKSIDSIIDSVNIKRDKTFLITCLREVIELCISHKNIGVFSPTLFNFYIRLIFWNSRCMKIDIFSKNIAKCEIIEYVLHLYFFNKKYKCFAKLFLLNYPFNTIRSHIVCFHNTEPCGESCEELQYKTLDECFDHISSTLLVDILFEEFYNDGPITLSQFYYSLISLSRMNKSEIVRIYEIFTKYLDLVRNFSINIKKSKLKVIENEINALKERAKQEGDYGALMSEKQKRTTELESLRLEVDELKDSLEEELKKIDSIGTRFSRASALKIGVEKVLSEHLTNDEIIKSISKLERRTRIKRKSSVFSNKKRVDSIYKLKVT